MAEYDDEIYRFLTSPENFKSAWDVSQKFNEIKDTIRKDFWLNVGEKLKKLILDDFSIDDRNILPQLNMNGFKGIIIGFESSSKHIIGHGLLINIEFYDIEKINKYLEKFIIKENNYYNFEKGTEYYKYNDKWIIWTDNAISDYEEKSTFLKMLPNENEELVNSTANILGQFYELIKVHLKEIDKMQK